MQRNINPWFIALTVTLATFMELLDTAVANVSLPHIAGGMATSYDESEYSNPRKGSAPRHFQGQSSESLQRQPTIVVSKI